MSAKNLCSLDWYNNSIADLKTSQYICWNAFLLKKTFFINTVNGHPEKSWQCTKGAKFENFLKA